MENEEPVTSAALLSGLDQDKSGDGAVRPPNILFMMVDQLRFPTVFPEGIKEPGEFLCRFMPNLFALWEAGVKFGSHYTAGCACTPSRGTIISGLYTQQSWLLQTILATPDSNFALQPPLNKEYPTYGRLLREAGYKTPYAGKWHVSIERNTGLEAYGFEGLVTPDPTGSNLQGTIGNEREGYLNDQDIATAAMSWLKSDASKDGRPWCLTVSFVNPHDKEFFWAGTEFEPYNAMFPPDGPYKPFTYYSQIIDGQKHQPLVDYSINPLKSPPNTYGYPLVPPNWETPADLVAHNKPSAQTMTQLFQEAVWGGVAHDPGQTEFTIAPYPIRPGRGSKPYGVASAPYSYWQRSLDSYTQIMTIVDQRIGDVLRQITQLPDAVRDNTVIVFTSDHGEYAGAHGYPSGKVGTCYDEAFHVPLIVADLTGRFNGDRGDLRTGLTSSVDMLPFLVSLAHNGSRDWMQDELSALYRNRHDIIAMLRSAQAPGRPYVLLVTDEVAPGFYNFNQSPGHIIAMRTQDAKLGTYAFWVNNTDEIDMVNGLETEYYDYSTEEGRLELVSQPSCPRAMAMKQQLFEDLVPNELRAPLPHPLRAAQALSRQGYLAYAKFLENYTPDEDEKMPLPKLIGFGREF